MDIDLSGMACYCGGRVLWVTHIIADATGADWGLLFTCDKHKGCRDLPINGIAWREPAEDPIVEEIETYLRRVRGRSTPLDG